MDVTFVMVLSVFDIESSSVYFDILSGFGVFEINPCNFDFLKIRVNK